MIRKNDFRRIEIEVQQAIEECFNAARASEKNQNDYILFLCNAHKSPFLENSGENPYTIDYRYDNLVDEHRQQFLIDYLNANYAFRGENTIDSLWSLSLELMIYTHIWESKPYLKQLKKLALLCNMQSYEWNIEIPDFTKHEFIRNEIRDIFKNKNLKIHQVLTNGFHSQLRNAFAHSEYSFGLNDPVINLHNNKGRNWEIDYISFDDWTVRFCYSFLLGIYIYNKFFDERQLLSEGEPGYIVELLDKYGNKKTGKLIYDKENDSFSGYMF